MTGTSIVNVDPTGTLIATVSVVGSPTAIGLVPVMEPLPSTRIPPRMDHVAKPVVSELEVSKPPFRKVT